MGNDKTIMYAPEGQLHDSVQASGVLNISDLSRKEIKNLAKKAAGWSGENGTFSWQDVASGQADIQGKFTRHEDLFRRRFNKQLEKNLHHTEQQQLLQAAKNGNPEAMGQYVASKRDDTAPIIGAVTVGPAALMAGIGTGALTGVVQGGKWLFNNPITGTTLDALGTVAGQKNFYSNNGYKKTIARAKEGDVWGAVASGAGDALDFLGPLDLLRRGKQVVNFIENPTHTYKFKYVGDIGDGSTRWQYVNEKNVDNILENLSNEGIVYKYQLPSIAKRLGEDVSNVVNVDANHIRKMYNNYMGNSPFTQKDELIEKFFKEIGWTPDADPKQLSKKLTEWSNPNSDHYNDYEGVREKLMLHSEPGAVSDYVKKVAADYGTNIKKAHDYVIDSYNAKHIHPADDGLNWAFDDFNNATPTLKVFGNLDKSTYNGDWIDVGFSPTKRKLRNKIKDYDDGITIGTLTGVTGHETGHGNALFTTKADFSEIGDTDWQLLTDAQKDFVTKINNESPYYHNNYDAVPERWKQLLKPTRKVNPHDFELAEGYADQWGTKANMYEMGIGKKASFDPNKKYNYFDLLRYKMTPTGMTDRFIIQRGGWWKGWKQQLDALNELYKKGGSIHIKKKNRGKFTESAKRAGMGVQEYARHVLANKDKYSSTLVKRANFARNAKKFKHEDGGIIKYQNPSESLPELKDTLNTNYLIFKETLPKNLRLTPEKDYHMYDYWKLSGEPKNFREGKRKGMFTWDRSDKGYHAGSIAEDRNTGIYHFMKPKHHPTVKYELDWFTKGLKTLEGGEQVPVEGKDKKFWEDFTSKYQLDSTDVDYRYVPIKK